MHTTVNRTSRVEPDPRNIIGIAPSIARSAAGAKSGAAARSTAAQARRRAEAEAATESARAEGLRPGRWPQTRAMFSKICAQREHARLGEARLTLALSAFASAQQTQGQHERESAPATPFSNCCLSIQRTTAYHSNTQTYHARRGIVIDSPSILNRRLCGPIRGYPPLRGPRRRERPGQAKG